MGQITYPPLIIQGEFEADMRRFLGGEGTDVAIAAASFAVLCEGDPRRGRPPLYAGSARTVYRVDGDGHPPPYVCVFDWGGDAFGVPALRVWYLQRGAEAPLGIGAFPAETQGTIPEAGEIEARTGRLLGAPGCYLEREKP